MRRPLRTRLLGAVLAPWLALFLAEPLPLHGCSMHGLPGVESMQGTAPVAIAPPSHDAMGMDHGAMAGMAHDAMGDMPHDAPGAPTDDAPGHHGHACTCLGGCCAPAPVSLAAPPALAWVPEAIARTTHRFAGPVAPAARAPHVLPFANGPPALTA
jgi:uncharacterized protein involved in copper resistance